MSDQNYTPLIHELAAAALGLDNATAWRAIRDGALAAPGVTPGERYSLRQAAWVELKQMRREQRREQRAAATVATREAA